MSKSVICNKAVHFGRKLSASRSHFSRRANRMQRLNLKKVKAVIGGVAGNYDICIRCLRTNRITRIRT